MDFFIGSPTSTGSPKGSLVDACRLPILVKISEGRLIDAAPHGEVSGRRHWLVHQVVQLVVWTRAAPLLADAHEKWPVFAEPEPGNRGGKKRVRLCADFCLAPCSRLFARRGDAGWYKQ